MEKSTRENLHAGSSLQEMRGEIQKTLCKTVYCEANPPVRLYYCHPDPEPCEGEGSCWHDTAARFFCLVGLGLRMTSSAINIARAP